MKITDVIRGVLDLIDKVEPAQEPVSEPSKETTVKDDDEIRRLKQIAGLESEVPYTTEPQEKYAFVNAVTDLAGGGPNGPKHPHDIRVKDPSMYPNQQEV